MTLAPIFPFAYSNQKMALCSVSGTGPFFQGSECGPGWIMRTTKSKLAFPLFALLFAFRLPLGVAAEPGTTDGSVSELLDRGLALIQAGDYGSARSVYAEVLAREPENPEALYRMGILSFLNRDFSGAASYLEAALKADPARQDAWKRLGDVYTKLERFKEAARSYGRACRIEYRRSIREREGLAWLSARDLERARKIFESLLLEDPRDSHAAYYLGNVLLAMGDPAHAERCYQAAILLKPDLVEAYVNLASIRFNEGKFTEAAGLLEKTFEVSPQSAPYDPKVLLNLGLSLWKAGERQKAETHFKKYLGLCPQCAKAAEVKSLLDAPHLKANEKGKGR